MYISVIRLGEGWECLIDEILAKLTWKLEAAQRLSKHDFDKHDFLVEVLIIWLCNDLTADKFNETTGLIQHFSSEITYLFFF